MARVKRAMMKNKRKSKILKLAKGFRNARSTKYKQAKQGVIRAGQHAFAHRRKKKRVMRKGWQIKINYAVREMTGMSYSKFIDVLTKKNIAVDRKIMADMIENAPESFERFLGQVVDGEVKPMPVVAASTVDTPAPAKKAPKKAAAKTSEVADEAPAVATSTDADDLTKIEGIGPKIAETLTAGGIATFAALADAQDADVQEMIKDVRGNHDAATWNEQAALARDGKWDELAELQAKLDGGKEA